MCGQSGVFGIQLNELHKTAALDLFFHNMARGVDSSGTAMVQENGTVHIFKELGTPDMLWEKDRYREIFETPLTALMTHNRAATKGTVTRANAHPFRHRHIIGMHNGTLRTVKKLDDHDKVGTDSEALLRTIANQGLPAAWGKMNGGAAIVYYNKSDRTITMARNYERPLHVMYIPEEDVVFWSSEAFPLTFLTKKYFSGADSEIVKIKEQLYLKWKPKDGELRFSSSDLKPYSSSGKDTTRTLAGGYRRAGKMDGGAFSWAHWTTGSTPNGNNTSETKNAIAVRNVNLLNRKMNDGNLITRAQFFQNLSMQNCVMCDQEVKFDDADTILMMRGVSCCDTECLKHYKELYPFVELATETQAKIGVL